MDKLLRWLRRHYKITPEGRFGSQNHSNFLVDNHRPKWIVALLRASRRSLKRSL